MATITPRLISSRFISNPDDSTQGVKLKVIDGISFIDKRRRNQETTFRLINDPTAGRRVKVVNVGDLSTSTTGDRLLVERILNFSVVDRRSRAQESRFALINAADPLIHYRTHKTKVYATDADGNKDLDTWVEVQRIDQIWVRDPRNRGQDSIFTLVWKDVDDPEWDYTDVPEPTRDWDGTTINPPWRLDPFQNIVDASWGGTCLFVMYSGNKVATFPMSQLYTVAATGFSGTTGTSGATGPFTPSYTKTLTDSNWGNGPTGGDWATISTKMLVAAQLKFDITPTGYTAATGATGPAVAIHPILWPFKFTEFSATGGATGYKMEPRDKYVLTAPNLSKQIEIGTQTTRPPIFQIDDGKGKLYFNNETVVVGPTGSFGATGAWPGSTSATGAEGIASSIGGTGTYHYSPRIVISSSFCQNMSFGTNLVSFEFFSEESSRIDENSNSVISAQKNTDYLASIIDPGLGTFSPEECLLARSYSGTENPLYSTQKVITAQWRWINGSPLQKKILGVTGWSDVSQNAPVSVYSATGGADRVMVETVTASASHTFETNVDVLHSPGAAVTRALSFLDVSVNDSFNTFTGGGDGKQHYVGYLPFPYALGATGGQGYVQHVRIAAGNVYTTTVYTPYGSFSANTGDLSGTYTWPGFWPWLHLSNGRVRVQGFVIDDKRHVYANGQNISNFISSALGLSDAKNIQMMLIDVPTSWVKKLT